ncbi:MAG: UDP-galactopyranose mutase [Treponema sp.]|jgi:UDP-galactopyranose mutase|nr:UDP-galactopyranose mutase [Treponema sp.]
MAYSIEYFDVIVIGCGFCGSTVARRQAEQGYTRITEYKKLPPQDVPGVTTVAYEYPQSSGGGDEPYYPILTMDAAVKRALAVENTIP